MIDFSRRLITRELESIDGKKKRKIRRLEHKLVSWTPAARLQLADPDPRVDFDDRTLAVLRGGSIKYKMQSREIMCGQNTQDNVVDVDLSADQPGRKVSRRQFTIRLKHDRQFYLSNIGKRELPRPAYTPPQCDYS